MRPIATHVVAWSVCVSVYVFVCVCVYITGMNPAKTAEPIEIAFGMWATVGPHAFITMYLTGVRIPQGSDNFRVGIPGHSWACPRSVYSTRQCGLLSNYFDLLLDNLQLKLLLINILKP